MTAWYVNNFFYFTEVFGLDRDDDIRNFSFEAKYTDGFEATGFLREPEAIFATTSDVSAVLGDHIVIFVEDD